MFASPHKSRSQRPGRRQSLIGLGALAGAAVMSKGAEAELVEVNTQSFTRLSEGSLQVTFQNGRSVIVPEGDWSIVDGRVFIENTAISQAGSSATSTAAISSGGGVSLFGLNVNPWLLAGGAALVGGAVAYEAGEEDAAPSSLGASGANANGIRASGTALTGSISNRSDATADDAGALVLADISPIFQDATGAVTYAIEVTDGAGAAVTDLVYLNGGQLLSLSDPGVDDNGIYTVKITATDTANGDTAEALAYVTVEVDSELARNGAIAATTMDENDGAGAVVVSDVSVFFKDAEGTLSFSVTAEAGGQDFGNVLAFSGNALVLNQGISDEFVELLNGVPGDEDIVLTVTVTAEDSADGTQLRQTFALTLDATGVNDAPELASGQSYTIVLNQDANGNGLDTGDAVTLDLSGFIFDEEGDALSWLITGDTGNSGLSIDANGLLSGTVASTASDGTIDINVFDADNSTSPATLSVYVDIA